MGRAALVLLACLPAAAFAAPAPDGPPARAAAKPKCFGKTATIVGTSKADRGRKKIVGTKKADVIVAKGGADDVRGGGGNDLICAGSGNDRVDGGSGNDRVDGGSGKDRLKAGAGNDELRGASGNDRLDGGRGVDMCDGGKGKNTLKRCEPLPLTGPGGPSGGGPTGPTGPGGLTRAAPDTATTTEDASTTIPVLANDTGNGLTIKSVDPGATKAKLTISGGSIVYDPTGRLDAVAAGTSITETFSYTVAAGSGATATGTVTVTVTGIDDAPLAVDDALAVDEGKQSTLDVLANDTDVDGGPKVIASVDTFGASGTVTIAADGGSLTYTPGIGVCGTTDTFTYTLEGGTTATVTVTIACSGTPPTAVDDSKTVAEDAAATAVDVLANDTDPDGGDKRVTSASDPANGTVVVADDGSGLTYAPDANYCNSPPGTTLDTFTYTLNGGSTGTVTVTVTCVDDAPSAVADSKTLDEDAAATAVDVLANDTDPDAGPKTVAGVTQGAHGAVVITGGGTGLTYKPALNFCGEDTFQYTLNGGSGATVTITVSCVNDPPVADDEAFTGAVGNTPFAVGTTHAEPRKTAAGDVLTGDTDVDSSGLTVQATTITTANGGSAVMEADGQFVYHPPAGFVGTDTFAYTVTDGDKTDTGQVSVTVAGRVWYLDAAAAAGGDGTGTKPFSTLASLNNSGSDVDAAGDHIFLLGGAIAGALTLENTQQLRSRSVGLNIGGPIVSASGANPSVGGVTLASGNSVQGVDLLGPLAGTNFGTAFVNTERTGIISSSGGPAIALDSGTLTTSLSSVTSENSSGYGVRLNAVNGTLTLSSGAINNAASTAFLVSGGTATIAYGGTITDDVGQLVSVANKSGGSVAFSGAISDGNDGDGGGIALTANTVPVSFSGGLTLSTGPNEAFAATGGGSLTVTGDANTIDASGGALRVAGTDIGAGGLRFRSIRSVGGSATGIQLDDTGLAGGLTVTGNGTPGSGGTISGKSGADLSTSTGIGVRLNDTRNVSLSRMQINDHQNYGILGTAVTNFSLVDSFVNGVNGTNANQNEAAISFAGLTGSGAITRSVVGGGANDNLRVVNTGGTLDRLTVDGSTFGFNQQFGNDAILLEATAGTFNVTVNNSTFQGSRGDQTDLNAVGTSISDFVFTNNTLTNTHSNSLGGGMNAEVAHSGKLTYRIENNTVTGAVGTAIVTGKLFGDAPSDGTAAGTISGNTIGSAVASSGSSAGSGIDVSLLANGKHSVQILNNTIREYSQHGILAIAGGASRSVTGLAHNGAFNLTVTGNTLGPPAAAAGSTSSGFQLISGTNAGDQANLPDQYQVCLNLNNNTFGNAGDETNAAGRDYVLRQRFETVVRLPGYAGAHAGTSADMTTALTNYLKPRDLTANDAFSVFASTDGTEYDDAGDDGFFNTAGGVNCPVD